MSEAQLVSEFIKEIKSRDVIAHISNIESHMTSAGIPDLDICTGGWETHVEIKFAAKDKGTPEIRPSQVRWFRKRIAAGGRPLILARMWFNGKYNTMIVSGHHIESLAREKNVNGWLVKSLSSCQGDMKTKDWDSIIEQITVPF